MVSLYGVRTVCGGSTCKAGDDGQAELLDLGHPGLQGPGKEAGEVAVEVADEVAGEVGGEVAGEVAGEEAGDV